jgi:hypothetical protein
MLISAEQANAILSNQVLQNSKIPNRIAVEVVRLHTITKAAAFLSTACVGIGIPVLVWCCCWLRKSSRSISGRELRELGPQILSRLAEEGSSGTTLAE